MKELIKTRNPLLRKKIFHYAMSAVILFALMASVCRAETDHSAFITTYEGSKTCMPCHEDAIDHVTQTLHYRLMGQPQDVFNMFTNEPVTGPQGKGNRY